LCSWNSVPYCRTKRFNARLGHTKKNVVFPLTRLTLNFSPDPKNFIDPLKKKNQFVPEI
jgi:hypothetical protein